MSNARKSASNRKPGRSSIAAAFATGPSSASHFNQQLVHKICENEWKYDSTDMKSEALSVTTEIVRLFVVELLHRATLAAKAAAALDPSVDPSNIVVEPEHVERILVQMMLDFQWYIANAAVYDQSIYQTSSPTILIDLP